MNTPECPHCRAAERQVKAGRNRGGSQRWQCRHCGRTYTPEPRSAGHPEATRREALKFYTCYYGLRDIARLLSVNPQSVINWVDAACARSQASGAETADQLTADVMARRTQDLFNRQCRADSEGWES